MTNTSPLCAAGNGVTSSAGADADTVSPATTARRRVRDFFIPAPLDASGRVLELHAPGQLDVEGAARAVVVAGEAERAPCLAELLRAAEHVRGAGDRDVVAVVLRRRAAARDRNDLQLQDAFRAGDRAWA